MDAIKAVLSSADFHGKPVQTLTREDFRLARQQGIHTVSDHAVRKMGGFSLLRDQVANSSRHHRDDPVKYTRVSLQLGENRRELKEAHKRIRDLEDTLEAVVQVNQDLVPVDLPKSVKTGGKRRGTAVLLASDWHVEETVDPRKANGRNSFGPTEAKIRVGRLAEGAIQLINSQPAHQIENLVLWLGGDLFSGSIHEELMESNALGPISAAIYAGGLARSLIDQIAESCPNLQRIIVPCNDGNHGRMTKKPRVATRTDNSLEWYMYHHLATIYANHPKVEFHVSEGELFYLSVYDFTLRFTHGDAVKYWGGVGGLSIPLNKAIAQWDTDVKADVTCLGHFHQYLPLPYAVVNGSLIGWSPFAIRIKARYEHARQAFFVIDPDEGPCMHTPIWVQKRRATIHSAVRRVGLP